MLELPPSPSRSRVGREWAGLGSALLALGLLVGYSLYQNRHEIDALERDRLRVQARVIADNLGHQFKGVDNALAGVRDNFPLWERSELAHAASIRLKALNDAMPGVRSIHILDAQGRVLATSRDAATVGRSFADRKLFTIPREHPNPATLYISPPYTTRRDQLFTVNATRVITAANGAFAGVVTAALDPEYFEVLLRSVLYAPDMRTALLHGDGTLFLYVPPAQRGIGSDRSTRPSFFTRHRDSGQTESVLVGPSGTTGDSRLMAMRTLRSSDPPMDQPLIVAVSRDQAAMYLPWRTQASVYGGLYLLFATAASLSLYAHQKRRRGLDRLAFARESERRESAERLELALAGADLGLWDWHVPGGKVVFNPRWFTMLGYAPGELAADFETWRALLHPDDSEPAQSAIAAHLKGTTPAYEIEHRLRHKDGRWLWILARGKVVQRDAGSAPLRMVGTHMDITARKAADAALSDSHVLTQQIIDSLPHGFVMRDAELRYRRWNPVMEKITGMPEEAVIGKLSAEVLSGLPPPLLDDLLQALRRALAGEIVVAVDRCIEGPGFVRWTSTIHGPLRNAVGTVVGTISSVLDITDRKKAEQQLQRNEASLAITLQSIADAVIATDAQGGVTRMNTSAERLTGWTAAQASGKRLVEIFRIVNTQTRQPVRDPVQLVLERGEVVGLANHTSLLARDGTEHQISDSAAPIRNAEGQVEGVVLVFSDVTDTYRNQQALEESEIRFRAIFDSNPESIEITNADGRLVDVNPAGLATFEAESSLELRERAALDFVIPEYREAFSLLHQGALSGDSGILEYEITGLRGTRRWLESHASPLRDAEGGIKVLVMSSDITRRKEAQTERRALREQLRESQKMEAIGTLAGGIAHDFNNLLGAISGNTQLALQDVGAHHPAALSLAQIGKACARARELVRQILAFSRRQAQDLVTQPLKPLVEEAMGLLRTTLPAMVRLEAELCEETLCVSADGTQVEQVLMNLCTNAWHALQGSTGTIVVGLGSAVLTADSARRLLAPSPGPYAHLWVSDTGIGMDADRLSRIFEPFFTTKPTGQGTGLGLSVVHGIVGAHRGAISVDSEPGKGSTFHVYLPLVEATEEVGKATADARPTPAGHGQHVLYLDDDEVMALMVERMLQRAGYQVSCFLDAAEAVAAVRARPERFDLVLTDFNMPRLSGLDVARALAGIRADLPVVISSGYISDELRVEAQLVGVRRLLQKQNTADELIALIHDVLVEQQA